MLNVFPRIPSPQTAQALHLAEQLESLARGPVAAQRAVQGRQLAALLRHARAHAPFWRARIDEATRRGNGQLQFDALPVLTRADPQTHFEQLRARSDELDARAISTARTSGSTGVPVAVERYAPLHEALYRAVMALEDRWSGRDGDTVTAVVRDAPDRAPTAGETWDGHRRATHVRNLIAHTPQALLDWLRAVRPTDLVTTPAMARRIAALALDDGGGPLPLQRVLTFGEVVDADTRHLVRAAFGARIVDRYTCEETGWIALQCPRHDHLHVLSGSVLVEIVDDAGRPCRPGEVGQVLLTGLHSFAMPLLRYALGDLAEAGGPCDCGLHLPVIRRVLGRERSFLRMPDGRLRLARLTGEHWRAVAPVREYRLVQYGDGLVEAFVTAARPLSPAELDALGAMLRTTLDPGLQIVVTPCDSLAPLARWKHIDVLRVDGPRPATAADLARQLTHDAPLPATGTRHDP
ncbi:MAG TPA: AMP-binding protein [Quisquiliibacterium sp.]|nr:AMP-binding protein [Quisquiliibacterium sp.]